MENQKIYFDGRGGGSSDISAILCSALQNRGLDTGAIMGMLGGGGGFGGFGGGGWNGLIALVVIAALCGNGNGGFFGGNNNNSAEREMIMSAIQRNGVDISQIASALNCSTGQIQGAISDVATQICNLAGQQGLSAERIINSILSGNNQLTSQIASCCCDIKQAIGEVNVGLERGFAALGFETQRQTCEITKAIQASTAEVLAGQRAAEMREMQRELAERDRKIAEQAVIINNGQQTAIFGQMITQATAPIAAAVGKLQGDVDGIKCKLPETTNVPYSPVVGVPTCVAAQYGLAGAGFGYGVGNGFWG